MNEFESGDTLADTPQNDMLYVWFRGDTTPTILPYCEVANGDIFSVNAELDEICIKSANQDVPPIKLSCAEFTALIEKSFATKDIIKLSVQVKQTYDQIKIL